jgi:hypothetical protein
MPKRQAFGLPSRIPRDSSIPGRGACGSLPGTRLPVLCRGPPRAKLSVKREASALNDPNAWVRETVHDPRYVLDLVHRVVRVSLEAQAPMADLPPVFTDHMQHPGN